jgi:hypothetical protein
MELKYPRDISDMREIANAVAFWTSKRSGISRAKHDIQSHKSCSQLWRSWGSINIYMRKTHSLTDPFKWPHETRQPLVSVPSRQALQNCGALGEGQYLWWLQPKFLAIWTLFERHLTVMHTCLELNFFRWMPRQRCEAAWHRTTHSPDDPLERIDDIVIFTYSYVSCHDLFLLDSGDPGIYIQEYPSPASYRHYCFVFTPSLTKAYVSYHCSEKETHNDIVISKSVVSF